MENEEIILSLESIGLSKNEVIVYLDLLGVGKSSAGDISKRVDIHRSNVYDTVEKLIKKGIITQTFEENRKVFYPISPKKLLDYFKQKEYDLETNKEILPRLDFDAVALYTLYKMRSGYYRPIGGRMIKLLPDDTFLKLNLPFLTELRFFNLERSKHTTGEKIFTQMYDNAIRQEVATAKLVVDETKLRAIQKTQDGKSIPVGNVIY